jgi:hypothetical protein
MTFLQYVAERLMGPPARRSATYGESYWCCPFHNDTHPSFHTLPSKPEFKDRWCCFGCGMRGDEADLMRELMSGEDWPRRRARLMEWRQDYERECEQATTSEHLLPGTGRRSDSTPDARQEECAIKLAENALADLTDAECSALIALKDKVGDEVSLDLLARVCRRFREWFVQGNAAHRAEGRDPAHCDDAPCRAARGLPPLTLEQIRAGQYRVDGHTTTTDAERAASRNGRVAR